MFCPNKNAYLQLVCDIDPRVISKAVRKAMSKKHTVYNDADLPAAQRLNSQQPSLFAPFVDVTQARRGFGRPGLQILIRELHSDNNLVKLRAVHTILHEVRVPENVLFLINLNVVNRVIDLMINNDPIIREKVAFILTHLANYSQGRNKILSHPVFIDRLILLFMGDRKEIRYAASLCLKTLTRERSACEIISKHNKIIESLIKMITNDHMAIVIFHLNSLKNLSQWDPVRPLKANAFQIMRKLLIFHQYRVVQAAMDCMTQLCKHSVGKALADKYDMTKVLLSYLVSPDIEVIISSVTLMTYTTMTTKSKWRAKEFQYDLLKRLVYLASSHNLPVLKLRAMQVIINLCDCPDTRADIKDNFLKQIIKGIKVRPHEQWDGTRETTTFCQETGLNHMTMCIEDVEAIRNDYGDSVHATNINCYRNQVRAMKKELIKTLVCKPDAH